MKLIIINGANLNIIGNREISIYGRTPIDDYIQNLTKKYPNIEITSFQSNIEGEIVTKIQEADLYNDGIILNAGGYTHTSVVIADAVRAISIPVIEVHISNILNREEYRHISLIAPHAIGCIFGFGLEGYRLAVEYFLEHLH